MLDPTWMNGDAVPLNDTALTPPSLKKPAPEIATTAPGHWLPSAGVWVNPLDGANPEIVAASADPAARSAGTHKIAALPAKRRKRLDIEPPLPNTRDKRDERPRYDRPASDGPGEKNHNVSCGSRRGCEPRRRRVCAVRHDRPDEARDRPR